MQLKIILNMKKHLLAVALISSQAYSHGPDLHHGPADDTATGFSVAWNSYEILNHAAALFGFGHTSCCSHGTKTYHAIELIGHSTNLFEGVSHFMEENTPHVVVPIVSLGFNVWAASAQYNTLTDRGLSAVGILLAPIGAMDLWGHAASAYVAVRELTGI